MDGHSLHITRQRGRDTPASARQHCSLGRWLSCLIPQFYHQWTGDSGDLTRLQTRSNQAHVGESIVNSKASQKVVPITVVNRSFPMVGVNWHALKKEISSIKLPTTCSLPHPWFIFLLCTYHFLTWHMFSLFAHWLFPHIRWFPQRHGFCLLCSLLYPRALNNAWHIRGSIHSCCMNEGQIIFLV